MNIYRLMGDIAHLIALVYLLLWIVKKKSCSGISAKTQVIHCLVFTLRYLDLFSYFISLYNTLMKLILLTLTFATMALIGYDGSYEVDQDNLRLSYLITPSFILGILFSGYYDVIEVSWTISIFLEAVAILPQLMMSHNRGESTGVIRHYMILLAFYKSMYCLNWAYRKLYKEYIPIFSIFVGVSQTIIYYFAIMIMYSDRVVFYDRDMFQQYKAILTESGRAQRLRFNQQPT